MSERDPLVDRAPTSHERQAGQPWDASYHDGPAPWDIGRPQLAVLRLAAAGAFAATTLDAGCGTGENAVHIAASGVPVLGFDVAETALTIAREKAAAREVPAAFVTADALRLADLGRTFATVLDCGLFHTFDADERQRYLASLATVTEPGATLYLLCFNDTDPGNTGPHPVSEADLRAAFDAAPGWRVTALEADRIETTFHQEGPPAWLATVART